MWSLFFGFFPSHGVLSLPAPSHVFEIYSMILCVSVMWFILLLNCLLFYGYTTFCLTIHSWRIFVDHRLWLLELILLWMFACRSFLGHVFYFSRSRVAELGFSFMLNFLRNCQTVFQVGAPFYIPILSVWGLQFLYIFTNVVLFLLEKLL